MTTHDMRTEKLIANRRAASTEKQSSTLATLKSMMSRGENVTFASVRRAAGVSSWFVYNNPVVRAAIESAIKENKNRLSEDCYTKPDNRTNADLRVELANARCEISDLRSEVSRLRQHLQRTLGEQVDSFRGREIAEQLRVAKQENSRLRDDLRSTNNALAESVRDRNSAVADRDGAQLALRQMMRQASS